MCDAGLTDPVLAYARSEGRAVIGGYVYRGSAVPDLTGVYVYGDWSAGTVWGLFFDENGDPDPRVLAETGDNILAFAQDHDGEIFIVTTNGFLTLEANTGENVDTIPTQLSDVECLDPSRPEDPLATMIPYDVNVTFWSNNGVKERFAAIPEGKTVEIESNGGLTFPRGSVFLKNFRHEGVLVETRLLVRHEDGGWAGYAYEWNEDQTDATLLDSEKTKTVHGQDWTYPSRAQCLGCHTESAGRVLGFTTEQLQRSFRYPSTGRTANQLATFEHIGLFNEDLPADPEDMPALADPTDESLDLETRARAYLHANCSNCHRPDNPIDTPLDFRYTTPLSEMGLCDVEPTAGDLGVDGAKLLVPGDPSRSLVSLRFRLLGADSMPPLGKTVVDEKGADLIDAWISTLTGCP